MGSVKKGLAVLATLADTTDFYARLDCLTSLGQTDLQKLHTLFTTTGIHLLSEAFADFRAQADPLMAAIAFKRAVASIGYGATISVGLTTPSRL